MRISGILWTQILLSYPPFFWHASPLHSRHLPVIRSHSLDPLEVACDWQHWQAVQLPSGIKYSLGRQTEVLHWLVQDALRRQL